jgi:hypothetical protein
MSKFFNIKTCPLCQQTLYLKYIDSNTVAYRCPTMVSTTMEGSADAGVNRLTWTLSVTHYEVSIDSSVSETKQATTVPPYQMITVAGSGRTKIYKWSGMSLIMETSVLLPDREPEKLAQRIKGLIIFS